MNLKEQIANLTMHLQPETKEKKIVLKDSENIHIIKIDNIDNGVITFNHPSQWGLVQLI